MDIPLLRENYWTDVATLLGRELDAGEMAVWQRETRLASNRIQRDLGLRFSPIQIQEGREGRGQAQVRVMGIAGTLQIQAPSFRRSLQIEIAPKFVESAQASGDWQASVLMLMTRARRRHYGYTPADRARATGLSFFDHVALTFAEQLEAALRAEPIRAYRAQEDRSPFLRGRLMLERQLQTIFDAPHLLHCEVDALDTNNPFNHLLHWACRRFAALVFDARLSRRLAALREHLPSVAPPLRLPARLPLEAPPQYAHFGAALETASDLARGQGIGTRSGRRDSYGYLLNMEQIYEGFIENSLRLLAARWTRERSKPVHAQPQDSHLYATPIAPTTSRYYTRPDTVLYRSQRPWVLLDAKYKRLVEADIDAVGGASIPATRTPRKRPRDKPGNADLYQLFASLVAHECGHGLLLYPLIRSDEALGDGQLKLWRVRRSGVSVVLGAIGLDITILSNRAGVEAFDGALAQAVDALVSVPL